MISHYPSVKDDVDYDSSSLSFEPEVSDDISFDNQQESPIVLEPDLKPELETQNSDCVPQHDFNQNVTVHII